MNNYKAKFLSFAALLAMAVAILPANASGVAVTVSVPANGEVLTKDAAGYATTTFGWTSSGLYSGSDQINVAVAWSDGVAPSSTAPTLLPCTPAPATAFGGTGSFTTVTANSATWSFSGPAAALPGSLCVRVPVTSDNAGTLASARNFSVAVISTGIYQDYGAVMFYVNGGDDVLVTATIPASLAFMITQAGSITTEQHTCALGTVTPGSVFTCDYRLKVQTNAANGLTITTQADHKLASGYATMTDVGEATVTAGTEGYGIALTGATTGGRDAVTGLFTNPIVEAGNFATDDSTQPTAATTILTYTNGYYVTGVTDTSLVTHRIASTLATPAGAYRQTVTYRATGSF
jgi:hypothetical protein